MASDDPGTVLLDVDGTLVDTVYLHVSAWAASFARVGLVVPSHVLHSAIGMGGDRLVAHVTNDATEDELGDTIREGHLDRFRGSLGDVRPTRGAEELIRELRQRGHQLAVASSADPDLTDDLLAIAGVDGLVSTVAHSGDVDASKPHPEVVETSADRAGGSPLLMLGDAPWDARAAADAGVPCVGVRTGGFGDPTLHEAGMVRVLEDPQEVLEQWPALEQQLTARLPHRAHGPGGR
ncbi:HAD family hydrolase [Nocardioides aestuarii]|uniref:HAD family hydrolase n=1 Tax=Nocardioides aestuarii TaxID=252231 RepID=A0ABW4TMR8_9ACTN